MLFIYSPSKTQMLKLTYQQNCTSVLLTLPVPSAHMVLLEHGLLGRRGGRKGRSKSQTWQPSPSSQLSWHQEKVSSAGMGIVHAKFCLFAMEILVVTEPDAIQAVSGKLPLWGGFFGNVSDIHSSQSL